MKKPEPTAAWSVQEFSEVAGRPWYALQRHNDAGVEWQFTGYQAEVSSVIRELKIDPVFLSKVSEKEFLDRHYGHMPAHDQLASALSRPVAASTQRITSVPERDRAHSNRVGF